MTAAQLPPGAGLPPPGPAILSGSQKYNKIQVQILAIYAVPQDFRPQDLTANATAEALNAEMDAQATAFEKGVPMAHVVRIPHAAHYVFNSNEADLLREMNTFLSTLKRD